jgi:MFS transporter, DHA1 family, inner membrane transport protein
MPRLLLLFSLANLVLGSGAFILGSLLEPMAADLGVSVPLAGQAMSVYALATAVLAPWALIATAGWPRRRAVLVALALYAAGQLVCLLAPHIGLLFAGRALMGLGAVFTPIAAGLALTLVPPAQHGRALALVFLGMSLSYVVGIPLGAFVGLSLGWRWPLAGIVLATLLIMALMARGIPRDAQGPGASREALVQVLRKGALWPILGVTALYFTAIFMVFSFVGPVLQGLNPMSSRQFSFTLVSFGVGGALGTWLGGLAADRFGAIPTLRVLMALLLCAMLSLPLTAGHPLAMTAVLMVWSTAGFGMMAPQQSRLAAVAGPQAPLALSLNTSMLYLGTALGAALGGSASGIVGFVQLPWVATIVAMAGMGLLWLRPLAPQSALPRPTT